MPKNYGVKLQTFIDGTTNKSWELTLHSGQNMPFSYWSVMFSIPVLQLIVLETGNVLMGHPN